MSLYNVTSSGYLSVPMSVVLYCTKSVAAPVEKLAPLGISSMPVDKMLRKVKRKKRQKNFDHCCELQ